MSAIAKPILFSTAAVNASPVNIELVTSIEKKDFAAINNQPAKYQIAFYFANGSKIFWNYVASATRNTEYTAVLAAAGVTVTA